MICIGVAAKEPLPIGALARWRPAGDAPSGPVFALAFSADGKFVASGTRDGVVRIWHGLTGNELRVFKGHQGEVKALAVAPDGTTVASAGADKTVRLWDAGSGKLRQILEGHQEPVEALVFAPDGKVLVSAGQDGAIIFWDAKSGHALRRLERHHRAVRGLAISHDGNTLASVGEDRNIFLWDFPAGAVRHGFKRPGWVLAVAFAVDGATLAAGCRDQTVHIRNLRPPYEFDSLGGYDGPIHSVALFADGKMVAAGNEDGKVRLWEVGTRQVRREFTGHTGIVHAVALSPDQSRLLSGGADGQIFVWDAAGLDARRPKKPALDAARWQDWWHDLGGPADPAFAAMGRLRSDPERLPSFLDSRFEPLFQMTKRLAELLPELDSDKFAVRQKATQELEAMGELVVPYLEEKLHGKLKLETQRRIELVMLRARSADTGGHSTFLQWWRTIEILEALGSAPARERLERLAKQTPDPRLRREAQAALERLRLPWHPHRLAK